MEYQNLSVEELQSQLHEVEQSRADLEKALYQRWQEAQYELVQEIREMIEQRGYDIDEILDLVVPRRRRVAATKKSASNSSYTRYVDPEDPGNVYIRGVLPRWMKEKMAAQGYDSSSKPDREAFKSNYLQAVQD